jgi:hypothetical protein
MTRDPVRIGRIATACLAIWLIYRLIWGAWIASVIRDPAGSLANVQLNGGFGLGAARPDLADVWVYLAVTLAAAISTLRWIVVVSRNAKAWSSAIDITPGWNAGWFLVPVFNLWKPFEGIRDVWAVTNDPDAHDAGIVPQWLSWCWGLWVARWVLETLGRMVLRGVANTGDVVVGGWLNLAAVAVSVPFAILAIRLIRQVSSRQRHRLATPAFS